jgi:TetR/AcrR family transcriptional regulator, cholesterol catabolism regulator
LRQGGRNKAEVKTGGKPGRPPHKDERLRQIVWKAAALFYENGYTQTSTRQIAEACGISKGLLYYYISSKEDFLDLFIQMTTDSFTGYNREILHDLPNTSPVAALKRGVKELITGIDAVQDMLMFWYRESGSMTVDQLAKVTAVESRAVEFIDAIIRAGKAKEEFTVADSYLAAYQIDMLCVNWALKRWNLKKRYTLANYIQHAQGFALAIAGYRGASITGPQH